MSGENQPDPSEIEKNGEENMTIEEAKMSKEREDTYNAGKNAGMTPTEQQISEESRNNAYMRAQNRRVRDLTDDISDV